MKWNASEFGSAKKEKVMTLWKEDNSCASVRTDGSKWAIKRPVRKKEINANGIGSHGERWSSENSTRQ